MDFSQKQTVTRFYNNKDDAKNVPLLKNHLIKNEN